MGGFNREDVNYLPPCKDCVKRFVGCHSSCNEYKEWKHFKIGRNCERAKYENMYASNRKKCVEIGDHLRGRNCDRTKSLKSSYATLHKSSRPKMEV